MTFTLRQHAGSALVAVAVFAAAIANGAYEPTAYAIGSIVLWAAVLAGLVGRSLPAGRVAPPALFAGACLAGVVVLAAASIGWAGDRGRAFDEAVRASAYLGLFVLAACTATPGGRRQWIAGLTVGITAVAAIAVASRLQPTLFPDPELNELIPSAMARLSYPIGYWNGLGALLALGAILLAHAGVDAGDRRVRAAAVGLMPIPLLGIYFADSRGALIACALGLALLVLASPRRGRQLVVVLFGALAGTALVIAASQMHQLASGFTDDVARDEGNALTLALPLLGLVVGLLAARAERIEVGLRTPSRRVKLALAGAAVVTVAGAAVALDPPERFEEFKQPPPSSAARGFDPTVLESSAGSGRWQFWEEAVGAFESAPVGGIGAGGYQDWWAQNGTIDLFVLNAHSLPLQQLAELGLVGGLLLFGFAGAVAYAGWRLLRAGSDEGDGLLLAVLAAAGLAAAIDWSWAIPAVFGPAVAAAGLLTASAPARDSERDRYAVGLGTVALAWVAMISAGLVLLERLKLEQSRDAAERGELVEGIDRAEEARTVQPWSPEPYLQLALLEEQRGDLSTALERLREAQQRDSDDWRLVLIEARLHVKRGDDLAGLRALDRAHALSPRSPVFGGPGRGGGD